MTVGVSVGGTNGGSVGKGSGVSVGSGAAVGGGFVLATVVTLYASRNMDPTTTGAVLLGSWLVKLVIALVVMMALRRMDFYDKGALVGTIIAALVVLLTAETVAVQRTKVPYTDPDPEDGERNR